MEQNEFISEQTKLGLEQIEFISEQIKFGLEQTKFISEQIELGLEQNEFISGQTKLGLEQIKFTSEQSESVFRTSIDADALTCYGRIKGKRLTTKAAKNTKEGRKGNRE